MYELNALKTENEAGLKHLEVVGFNGRPYAKELSNIEDYIESNNIVIRSVHIPTTTIDKVNNTRVGPNVEYLTNKVFRDNCIDICKYFSSISNKFYNGADIKVIFHSKTRLEEYESDKALYSSVKSSLEAMVGLGNIIVCLENVPIVHYDGITDKLIGCFGCGNSFIDVAEKLNGDISSVKVLIDTCHTESHNEILKVLGSEEEITPLKSLCSLAYNKGLLGQVHLASQTGLGILPGEHGISLEQNYSLSERMIQDIKEYVDDIDITIEVEEDSYPSCKNAMISYGIVKRILNRHS